MARSATDLVARKEIPTLLRQMTGASKNVNEATIRRWYKSGVKGVRLEVQFIGGQVFTTRQMLREFITATTFVGVQSKRVKKHVRVEPQKVDPHRAQRVVAMLMAQLGEDGRKNKRSE